VLLIIDISKHGAKEMGHVKMAGPGFVNDKDWLARNQENVSEWGDMSIRKVMFQ
jgi:outer membrane protease